MARSGSGMRLAALVVVAITVGTGCAADDSREAAPGAGSAVAAPATLTSTPPANGWLLATTDAGAGPPGAPALLVVREHEVLVVAGGRQRSLVRLDRPARLAVGDGGGTVVVELSEPKALVRVEQGRVTALPVAPGAEPYLYDAVVVGGAPHLLYGLRLDDGEPSGQVMLGDLATGRTTPVAEAFAVEFSTSHGSAAATTIVTGAAADLTEAFSFHGYDGEPDTSWPDPTEDLPYNSPPLLVDPVLSPDGEVLAYLSGPDVSGLSPSVPTGRWELVLLGRDRRERLRLPLAGPERALTRLDFDGRWAVVSSTVADVPEPLLLIDTAAARPAGLVLSAVRGVATIDTAARR